MVPWLRRRRLSVSSLAFAGWTRRFRRARDPRTTVARSVSGRVRRHDAAGEYGARTAEEWLLLTLIGGPHTKLTLPIQRARTVRAGSAVQPTRSENSTVDQSRENDGVLVLPGLRDPP